MKSKRKAQRIQGNTERVSAVVRDRWNPQENTRPQTFTDRKKAANKKACRGSGWD